ncbi:Fungal specific transcription factor domain-containing protein [Cladophialophora immunda]|nr:Fungal specific transcription factor domain-containing protein [Cladophialophora immunda]
MRNVAGESSEARKITRATVACAACRHKKVKCVIREGEEACTSCRDHKLECIILNDDRRKHKLSRAYVNVLQDRIRHLESFVQQMGHENPVVVGPANNDQEPAAATDEDVSPSPHLEPLREISFERPTTGEEPLHSGGLDDWRASNADLLLGDESLPLSQSTTSQEEDVLLEEAYWSGQNAVFPLVIKPLFIADRASKRPRYYSRALQTCMIAIAARCSSAVSSSRQRQLHSTARQKLRVEDNQDNSLASVQSLLLFADLECAIGNLAQASTLHFKAGEMLNQMLGMSITLPATTSPLAQEAIWRTVTFYTVTSQLWYILDNPRPCRPPGQHEHIEKFLSKKLPQQGPYDAYSQSRVSTRDIWVDLMRISTAAITLERSSMSSTDRTLELESLARLDAECHDWYCGLPWDLRCTSKSRSPPPAEFFALLMCYHSTLIVLHRQKAGYRMTDTSVGEESFSPATPLSSISRSICLKNAVRLSEVLSHYRQRYQLSHLGPRVVLFLGVASAALAAEIYDVENGPERESEKQHLSSLLDAFKDISENMQLAEQPARLLSRFINTPAVPEWNLDLAADTDLLAHLATPFTDLSNLEQGGQFP